MAATTPTTPVITGYVSYAHSVRAIGRCALAYSNLRRLWWPLAYLELPLMWFINAIAVARRPHDLITAGQAVAMRPDPTATRTLRPRPSWALLASLLALSVALLGVPLAVAETATHSWQIRLGLAWLLALVFEPLLSFGARAIIQLWAGRGTAALRTYAHGHTGRQPVLASQLAAWPCTGGGRTGTGDGFTLIRWLAADARSQGAVLIGVARTAQLAAKYQNKTGATASTDNPRHLYWP